MSQQFVDGIDIKKFLKKKEEIGKLSEKELRKELSELRKKISVVAKERNKEEKAREMLMTYDLVNHFISVNMKVDASFKSPL